MNTQLATRTPTSLLDCLTATRSRSSQEPTGTSELGRFKLALYSGDVQLGWLGRNSRGWAIVVQTADEAVTLEAYPLDGVTYYRVKGSSEFMSISSYAYVGFYGWVGAHGWTRQGSRLLSDENQQPLSFFSKDNGYLYCWNQYTVLDIAFIEQVSAVVSSGSETHTPRDLAWPGS